MVKTTLQVMATLENVVEARPGKDFTWFFKFKCAQCDEVSERFIAVSADEKEEIPGSRGSANAVVTCKLCKRTYTVDIVPGSVGSIKGESFCNLVSLECRGAVPVEFDPQDGWAIEVEGGGKYDADLSEKEWADFDENIKEAVSIQDMHWRFQ